ncbi:hypothetical protein RCH06_002261 [Polaromonas sp. CG_9.5]|nr:hypothetical protein [Polaromonas sp. CG_9.5]
MRIFLGCTKTFYAFKRESAHFSGLAAAANFLHDLLFASRLPGIGGKKSCHRGSPFAKPDAIAAAPKGASVNFSGGQVFQPNNEYAPHQPSRLVACGTAPIQPHTPIVLVTVKRRVDRRNGRLHVGHCACAKVERGGINRDWACRPIDPAL